MKPVVWMWSTGELRREFRHVDFHDGQRAHECLVIRRPLEPGALPVVIELTNAHVYWPKTADELAAASMVVGRFMVDHLHLPVDATSVRRFIDYVQDGLEELLKMKPGERSVQKIIGFDGELNGMRLSGEFAA